MWYQRFIENCSVIAKPLFELISGAKRGNEADDSFSDLSDEDEESCTQDVVTQLPDDDGTSFSDHEGQSKDTDGLGADGIAAEGTNISSDSTGELQVLEEHNIEGITIGDPVEVPEPEAAEMASNQQDGTQAIAHEPPVVRSRVKVSES
ncbi:hypothetical protein MHYP_G00105770 [Metynnis hypsauchen]